MAGPAGSAATALRCGRRAPPAASSALPVACAVGGLLAVAAQAPFVRTRAPPPFPAPPQPALRSVLLDGPAGEARLAEGRRHEAAAWGSFVDTISATGWAVLHVHSDAGLGPEAQGYATGFLEGSLTHERISQQLANTWTSAWAGHEVGAMPASARAFLAQNLQWMRQEISAHRHSPGLEGDYWRLTGALLAQLRGMADGYQAASSPTHDDVNSQDMELRLYVATLMGADLDGLNKALRAYGRKDEYLGNGEDQPHHHRRGHCSAFVQLAPGNADLWAGHSTFDDYRSMLRFIKYVDMPLPGAKSTRMSFSSYPGALASLDDFYVTDTGLAVMETTLENYNKTLLRQVRPQSMLTWARTMLATRLATGGAVWTELQARLNSGTCNNQWIVVDYKRFHPGEPLKADTLWISETVPGHEERADMTGYLHRIGSSWSSYNVPFFEASYRAAGWGDMEAKAKAEDPEHAEKYSFTGDPRGKMFERAQEEGWVTSLDSFMGVMRYNNYTHDPLAKGNPCNSISARCDLNRFSNGNYHCFGAQDSKVAHWRAGDGDLSFLAVASPTFEDLRPFSWSEQDQSIEGCRSDQHVGHPETFNFSWYTFPDTFASEARAIRWQSLRSWRLIGEVEGGSADFRAAAYLRAFTVASRELGSLSLRLPLALLLVAAAAAGLVRVAGRTRAQDSVYVAISD